MNIFVCIKQVPSTNKVQVDEKTGVLKRDGIASKMNPYDLYALETALRLREANGGRVVVGTMGPPQAEKALREALAMGADSAHLITDRAFGGSDTLATSTIIAAAIRKLGCDVVFCGRQAIDGDTAQVGPQIAEHLDLPQITYAAGITYSEGENTLTVKRQFEDRYQILQVQLPCLITVLSTMTKPRYMNMWDIVSQDEKEIGRITNEDLQLEKSVCGLGGSPTKVKASFTKQLDKTVETKELAPEEAAKAIIAALQQRHLI